MKRTWTLFEAACALGVGRVEDRTKKGPDMSLLAARIEASERGEKLGEEHARVTSPEATSILLSSAML